MHDSDDLDLSIQLQDSEKTKSKEQQLEEFVELTRKLAESDRKNELFREAKSNKMNELQKLRSLYRESVQERCGPSDNKFVDFLKEGRAVQKNESISDESDMWMGDSAHWQKDSDRRTSSIVRENQRLENKIASMSTELQELLRVNKEKQLYLESLKKKREAQLAQMQANEKITFELQRKCDGTKKKGEQLQQEYIKELSISKELKEKMQRQERQLELRRKEKEDIDKKQQQNKRSLAKIVQQAKAIEKEIDKKQLQISRMESIHAKLEREVEKEEQAQKKLEEILSQRRDIMAKLRKCNNKICKEKEAHAADFQAD